MRAGCFHDVKVCHEPLQRDNLFIFVGLTLLAEADSVQSALRRRPHSAMAWFQFARMAQGCQVCTLLNCADNSGAKNLYIIAVGGPICLEGRRRQE